jgi:glycerophosphoryl diester phosphodiesterase
MLAHDKQISREILMEQIKQHHWFDGLPDRYVIAHRGAAGVCPENTMAAFEQAQAYGADGFELDVHVTADGQLVVIHDDEVDRVTEATGRVRDATWDTLQQLDAGYRFSPDGGTTFPWRNKGVRIPLLQEVLDAFPDTRLVIEIKPDNPAVTTALADLLQQQDRSARVLVCSFLDQSLQDFRRLAPAYATGAGVREVRQFVLRTHLHLPLPPTLPYHALTVPPFNGVIPVVTRRTCASARQRGLQMQVWTINEPPTMRRLYEAGAHAMTTDYPDRAIALLKEME